MIQGRQADERYLRHQMTTEADAEKWLSNEIWTCYEKKNKINKINRFSSRNLMRHLQTRDTHTIKPTLVNMKLDLSKSKETKEIL
jgi:hypothetical protein